jgi:hypothetical protein
MTPDEYEKAYLLLSRAHTMALEQAADFQRQLHEVSKHWYKALWYRITNFWR